MFERTGKSPTARHISNSQQYLPSGIPIATSIEITMQYTTITKGMP